MRDAQETHPRGKSFFWFEFFLSSSNFLTFKNCCWWDPKSDCVAPRLEFSIPRDWGTVVMAPVFSANVTKPGWILECLHDGICRFHQLKVLN